MNQKIEKAAGLSLLIGAFLMFVTMALHPTGGNFEHLLKVRVMGTVVHSIALVSIPFTWIGFRGITSRLSDATFLSQVAYAFITFALIAVMFAAAANGLVLSGFIGYYADATPEVVETIKPILYYGSAFNHACDFIFIAGICISVLLWSIAILKTRAFPIWLGWLGLPLAIVALLLWAAGFIFVDLHGFRLFIFGTVVWIVCAGFLLMRTSKTT
ncbi:hypothetical protein POV27_05100 [Aureisphaera galaxeae]|uniref:hypothetical protein n=1 Tax=Aureisphaera galaxeae TaxID=1538023 RepID=UPI0023506A25|nr:hypothetical protein [Aureisphaera galaxeae]MDC8003416.1 hypothetical protein [Aureisphaera galaxeae]